MKPYSMKSVCKVLGQKFMIISGPNDPLLQNLASVTVLLRMHEIIKATYYTEISLKCLYKGTEQNRCAGCIIWYLGVDFNIPARLYAILFPSCSALAVHYISTSTLQIKPISFQVVSAHEFSAGIGQGMKSAEPLHRLNNFESVLAGSEERDYWEKAL